jgi:hypothetical protein
VFEDRVVGDELAQVPPGVGLAAALARLDLPALNGFEVVEVAKAISRQIAHYQAELLATVRESAYCPPGDQSSPPRRTDQPEQFAADETRFALSLTRGPRTP